jgi:hypothetical protein
LTASGCEVLATAIGDIASLAERNVVPILIVLDSAALEVCLNDVPEVIKLFILKSISWLNKELIQKTIGT